MKRNDFKLNMNGHEARLLVAGGLLGLAFKSTSLKGKIFYGAVGAITMLGDVVQVDKAKADQLQKIVEKAMENFADRYLPEEFQSDKSDKPDTPTV